MLTVTHNNQGTFVRDDVKKRIPALDAAYAMGWYEPNYPVPAVPLKVILCGQYYMYDTVYVELDDENDPVIVCLWDFNFDRCIDFSTPLGEYQWFETPHLRSE